MLKNYRNFSASGVLTILLQSQHKFDVKKKLIFMKYFVIFTTAYPGALLLY